MTSELLELQIELEQYAEKIDILYTKAISLAKLQTVVTEESISKEYVEILHNTKDFYLDGLDLEDVFFPPVEAFTVEDAAPTIYKETMEGIGNIIRSIIDAIKKAISYVVNLIRRILGFKPKKYNSSANNKKAAISKEDSDNLKKALIGIKDITYTLDADGGFFNYTVELKENDSTQESIKTIIEGMLNNISNNFVTKPYIATSTYDGVSEQFLQHNETALVYNATEVIKKEARALSELTILINDIENIIQNNTVEEMIKKIPELVKKFKDKQKDIRTNPANNGKYSIVFIKEDSENHTGISAGKIIIHSLKKYKADGNITAGINVGFLNKFKNDPVGTLNQISDNLRSYNKALDKPPLKNINKQTEPVIKNIETEIKKVEKLMEVVRKLVYDTNDASLIPNVFLIIKHVVNYLTALSIQVNIDVLHGVVLAQTNADTLSNSFKALKAVAQK